MEIKLPINIIVHRYRMMISSINIQIHPTFFLDNTNHLNSEVVLRNKQNSGDKRNKYSYDPSQIIGESSNSTLNHNINVEGSIIKSHKLCITQIK